MKIALHARADDVGSRGAVEGVFQPSSVTDSAPTQVVVASVRIKLNLCTLYRLFNYL